MPTASRRRRFAREIRLSARLRHPAIISVLAAEPASSDPFLTMRWIGGRSLDRWIAERATLEQRLGLLSNVITALSSFFLAKDLDLLVAAPVDWLRLYGAKLLETCLHSSWMVVLLAVPMFAALAAAATLSLAYNVVVAAGVRLRGRLPRPPTGAIVTSLIAVVLVLGVGNLDPVRQWSRRLQQVDTWHLAAGTWFPGRFLAAIGRTLSDPATAFLR